MAISSVKATVNGVTSTLTLNSSTGAYEGNITAPAKSSYSQTGGYYSVTLTAYDDAGNSATISAADNDALKLVVVETTPPTFTPTYPTNGATIISAQPNISWTVTDNDSGVNASSIGLKIDGTDYTGTITKTASSGAYACVASPTLTDGSHTLTFVAEDNDGNEGTSSITFKVDTTAPQLVVSQPADDCKVNVDTIVVSGYTSDSLSTPVSVTVNGITVTVDSEGYFTTTVSLSEGNNTITVVATDAVGLSTTVTRTVNYNNTPPEIDSFTLSPNPVNAGQTFLVSVVVHDE